MGDVPPGLQGGLLEAIRRARMETEQTDEGLITTFTLLEADAAALGIKPSVDLVSSALGTWIAGGYRDEGIFEISEEQATPKGKAWLHQTATDDPIKAVISLLEIERLEASEPEDFEGHA